MSRAYEHVQIGEAVLPLRPPLEATRVRTRTQDVARPPRLRYRALIGGLGHAQVRYVLTGSAAAAAYGLAVEPRDFDLAPDLAPENLSRLAGLLADWGAKPQHIPSWDGTLTPAECDAWHPFPATPENLDHLLVTPHGLLDVVPAVSGSYAELRQRALRTRAYGFEVFVAHPSDLIATMRPRAPKHEERLPALFDALDRVAAGEAVVALDRLIA